ncbi:hypothetical protein GCM10022377_09870 [Zhihengliuella alba]|uniref:DUF695 domain-containing protein n=1 Tax=Zhihengliuella alba TaxID=547018 RepID=A0ABP7D442_9MICC
MAGFGFGRFLRRRRPAAPGPGGSARPPLRCFPGWAGSLLWWPFPLDYEETALPAELVSELRDWEARWEARSSAAMGGDDADLDAGTDADVAEATEQQRQLVALATRVAEELGAGYCIELDDPDAQVPLHLPPRKLRLASSRPGSPDVVAAFERLEERLRDDLYPERNAPAPGERWYAYAPRTGAFFSPRRRGRRGKPAP